MRAVDAIRHQGDHLILGVLVFLVGVVFERTHRFHHGHR